MQQEELTAKYEISMEAMKACIDHLELSNQLMNKDLERIDYFQNETSKSLKRIKNLKIVLNLILVIFVPLALAFTVNSVQQCLT